MPRDFEFFNTKTDMKIKDTPSLRSILDYLERNLKKGYKLDDLRYVLLGQGYSRVEVDEGIKIIEEKGKKSPEPMPKKIQIIQPKSPQDIATEGIRAIESEGKKGFWGRLFG
jgi:hypothetical protein